MATGGELLVLIYLRTMHNNMGQMKAQCQLVSLKEITSVALLIIFAFIDALCICMYQLTQHFALNKKKEIVDVVLHCLKLQKCLRIRHCKHVTPQLQAFVTVSGAG